MPEDDFEEDFNDFDDDFDEDNEVNFLDEEIKEHHSEENEGEI